MTPYVFNQESYEDLNSLCNAYIENFDLGMNDIYENMNIGPYNENRQKKAHTSFDRPKNLPGLKKKLDIINEEEDDDIKYITDSQINNNNFGNERKLNSLEILMKQRMFYQNRMPNNSRFKLKKVNQ